jgi:hypothetical protein
MTATVLVADFGGAAAGGGTGSASARSSVCARMRSGCIAASPGGARRLAVRGSISRIGVGEPFAINAGERICPAEEGDSVFSGNQFDYRLRPSSRSRTFSIRATSSAPMHTSSGSRSRACSAAKRWAGARQCRGGWPRAPASRRGSRWSTDRRSRRPPCSARRSWSASRRRSIRSPRDGSAPRSARTISWTRRTRRWIRRPATSPARRSRYASPAARLGDPLLPLDGRRRVLPPGTPRWVRAFGLRLGNFFRTATIDPEGEFLPPEERFYAGGASSVRGLHAQLPGTRHLRDGWRARSRMRTGELDRAASRASSRREARRWLWRVSSCACPHRSCRGCCGWPRSWTPARSATRASGTSARSSSASRRAPASGLQTPVGPGTYRCRLQSVFGPATAPLLVIEPSGGLRRVGIYTPGSGSFFSRMRVHLGVGHAF